MAKPPRRSTRSSSTHTAGAGGHDLGVEPPSEDPVGPGALDTTIAARPHRPPKQHLGPGPGNPTMSSTFAEHPRFTGRKLLRVTPGEHREVERLLKDKVGLKVEPYDCGAVAAAAMPGRGGGLPEGQSMYFARLGILTVNVDPDQAIQLAALAAERNSIEGSELERYVFAGADPAFLHGYRAGVNGLIDELLGEGGDSTAGRGRGGSGGAAGVEFRDDQRTTWGVKATRADATRSSGNGIRVAVLDTGIDLTHPDFMGRIAAKASFVPGNTDAHDGHGHGTHCAGVAAGPLLPAHRPRYGVATGALLYVAKVLDDNGVGTDTSILGGIEWALDETQKCVILSMSLGASVEPNAPRSAAFEQVGRQALVAGAVIIAAAGNDSDRPGNVAPVSHPANCRTFMAVAALDARLRVAGFSNAGRELDGGQVDFVGPGVDILSAVPGGYAKMSGTSMATPHVAGLAALLAEKEPDLRGHALLGVLSQRSLRLDAASADVGAGLAQAP